MKKTPLILTLTLIFTLFICQSAFAENELKIMLDGQKFELSTPYAFKSDRTMITIDSGLFEKLKAEVRYVEADSKVWIEGEYSTVELTLNEAVAYVHRKFDFTGIPLTVEMDVEPFIKDNKVYVPLRFVAEGLDVLVDWDGINKAVLIKSANTDIIPVEKIVEYTELGLHDVSEELAKWVNANRMNRGTWFKTVDDITYILICAGEKPTGGYSMQLDGLTMVAPGSIYYSAQVISPAPDMMVTQALTYPFLLIAVENIEILAVDGTINDGASFTPKPGENIEITISPEDILDITLFDLMEEKVKVYKQDEFANIAEAFNNAKVDDSFYIMMIAGNRMVVTMKDNTTIQMTSYGSKTNIVALMLDPDGKATNWHLICPYIAKILLETE
ncbi:MAG: stalk domain-containing protein [Ruminiclostridium sp.]|nr:stalk domain-containing protein [Ruminiclostridium sp.]